MEITEWKKSSGKDLKQKTLKKTFRKNKNAVDGVRTT